MNWNFKSIRLFHFSDKITNNKRRISSASCILSVISWYQWWKHWKPT